MGKVPSINGALLREANLSDADLREANLCGANFSGANLREANLRDADLREARLFETVLSNVDLSHCKNLDSVVHHGPSTIDIRTLQRSGRLPLVFLRGVGLPDTLIEYLPSLLGQAIDFYSCFISYNHNDKSFARRLHDQLQGRGIRCWLDEHHNSCQATTSTMPSIAASASGTRCCSAPHKRRSPAGGSRCRQNL